MLLTRTSHILFLSAVFVGTLFGLVGEVSAQQCCVVQEVVIRRYSRGFTVPQLVGNERRMSETPIDCRASIPGVSVTVGCSSNLKAQNKFERVDVSNDPNTPSGANNAHDYWYTEEIGPVACASFAPQVSACADILKSALSECRDNDGDSAACLGSNHCLYQSGRCSSLYDASICGNLTQPNCARSNVCNWRTDRCLSQLESNLSNQYIVTNTGNILPPCAFDGTCNDVEDLIGVVINITREILKYIGVLAFVFFIVGGGTMIASFGNPERFKKGQQILVAASVGLVISLTAFVLVSFILTSLGVSDAFRII